MARKLFKSFYFPLKVWISGTGQEAGVLTGPGNLWFGDGSYPYWRQSRSHSQTSRDIQHPAQAGGPQAKLKEEIKGLSAAKLRLGCW